jgi:hypothetical protein
LTLRRNDDKMTTHCGLPFPDKGKLRSRNGRNVAIVHDKLHAHSTHTTAATAATASPPKPQPPKPHIVGSNNRLDRDMGRYRDINRGEIEQGTNLDIGIGIGQRHLLQIIG